jgi:hypothetical protein
VTPDQFFPKERSADIDKQALSWSREWHKLIEPGTMSYRGISFGEVLEYELYHLFVGVLRSAVIADAILNDPFDKVYLPSTDHLARAQGIGFSTLCYETLPPILAEMAARKGLKVARLEHAGRQVTKPDHKRTLYTDPNLIRSCALFFFKNRRDFAYLIRHRNRPRMAFVNAHEDGIIEKLRECSGRGVMTYPSFIHTPRSRRHAANLLSALRDEASVAKIDIMTTFRGTSLWRVVLPIVDNVLSVLVPLITARIHWTESFSKRFKPSSLVVYDDVAPLKRTVCLTLERQGVPVVVLQHGILTNDMAGMYVLPRTDGTQAVWGEYYRQWHLSRGKQADSQVVTGFSRHDNLLNMPPLDRDRLCERFGLDSRREVVLVATEWFQGVSSRYTIEHQERYIRMALKTLKACDDVQTVVKLHPGHQAKYRKIVSEIAAQEGAKVIIAGDSLWDLIRLSSFVIVSVSSVSVEALILGRPVISLDLVDGKDISGLVQDGLAMGASDEAGLERAIRKCLKDPESCVAPDGRREELLLPFTGSLDGQSSRRVAELIETMATRSQR